MADPTASPRKSQGSTISSITGGQRKQVQPDFEFNLGATKAKVLKSLEPSTPAVFRKFFTSAGYDRLLTQLMLHFVAVFQHEALSRSMERARRQHLEGYNPYTVAARLHELENEIEETRQSLSPCYMLIILHHASYQKPVQDRLFFEALYSTLLAILDDAFTCISRKSAIESQVGELFRGNHFNLNARAHKEPRSVDTLSVAQIWALKNETTNRSLHAKTIASLYQRPPTLGVQVACLSHTPLVSDAIMSPIIARAGMKEAQRRARQEHHHSRSAGRGDQQQQQQQQQQHRWHSSQPDMPDPAKHIRTAFQTIAAAKGVNLKAMKAHMLKDMDASSRTLATAGIVGPHGEGRVSRAGWQDAPTSSASPRITPRGGALSTAISATSANFGALLSPERQGAASARVSMMGGIPGTGKGTMALNASVLPELSGLLADETYNYLALLRRYILHGPTLGLQQPMSPATKGPNTHVGTLSTAPSGSLM